MKTVSIVGCGWLGWPLAETLLQQGYHVRGSTTSSEKYHQLQAAGIEAYQLRLTADGLLSDQPLDDLFKSEVLVINIPPGRRRPDVATVHPQEIDHLLSAAAGAVQRILFISSTGVYPDVNRIVTEADPAQPATASGQALLAIETLLHARPHFAVTILRMAGLVGGERQPGRFLAGREALPNGAAPVNLVHRDDCIRVICEVLRQEKWGELYNVCANTHPTRRDFYTAQAKLQGLALPDFLPGESAKYKIVSNAKVKTDLGVDFQWQP